MLLENINYWHDIRYSLEKLNRKMKKLLLVGLLACTSTLFAQKGSWYVGGAVGFSSSTVKNGNNAALNRTSWAFSPEVGTFLTDKIQLGIGVTMNGFKGDIGANTIETGLNHGATVYGRYFFGDLAFKPFVGVNLTVLPGSREVENTINNSKSKSTSMHFGSNVNAGFAYALSPRITAVGSFGLIGYSTEIVSPNGGGPNTVRSGFDMNLSTLGNRFTVGIYYTFKGAKE